MRDGRVWLSPTFAGGCAVFLVLALLGGVALAAGFFLAPQRTWIECLLASNFLIGLAWAGFCWWPCTTSPVRTGAAARCGCPRR